MDKISSIGIRDLEHEILNKRQNILIAREPEKYKYLVFALNFVHPGLRLGYYAGRWIDDVVDGDEPLPGGFESIDSWINQTRDHILSLGTENEVLIKEPSVTFMFQQAVFHLQPLENQEFGDNVKREFADFLVAMRGEYHRRMDPKSLTEEEILSGYWASFSHAQNITLIALGGKKRIPINYPSINELLNIQPKEMPLILPIILGKAYTIDGLSDDLKKGICNIPESVLNETGLDLDTLIINPEMAQFSPVILNWIENERKIYHLLARKLRRKKMDFRSKLLVRFLTSGI